MKLTAIIALVGLGMAAPNAAKGPEVQSGDNCEVTGQIDIYNSCPFDVEVWADDSSVEHLATLPGGDKGAHFAQNLRQDDRSGFIGYRLEKATAGRRSFTQPALMPMYTASKEGVSLGFTHLWGNPFREYNISYGASHSICKPLKLSPGTSIESVAQSFCKDAGNIYVKLCDPK